MPGDQPPVLFANDTRLLFSDEEKARGWDEDAEANESVFVLSVSQVSFLPQWLPS